jgi:hypothetical protein
MTEEPTNLPAPAEFEWLIYADATFAGLSLLIPIPLVDLAFEWYFRQRIGPAIGRRRGRPLSSAVIKQLNKGEGCLGGCLGLPFKLAFELLKRLSRKILYFLTIKEATDQLSSYWHRAYLLDHMIRSGYLADHTLSQTAVDALNEVLDHPHISPLNQLAHRIVTGVSHIFRTLRRVRGGEEDEVVKDARSLMARNWDNFSDYFVELTAEYEKTFGRLREATANSLQLVVNSEQLEVDSEH